LLLAARYRRATCLREVNAMRATMLALSLVTGLSLGTASAQSPSGCPAPAQETTGAADRAGPDGNERPAHQPIERSAILPDAGGEGQSAAPTVQQNGQSVVAQTDCPKPPNRIDAPKPQ